MLVAAGAWQHFVRRVPLRYVATLWSIVFPIGMYAVAGTYPGRTDRLPIVEAIGGGWLWVAVSAWVVVAVSMVRHAAVALTGRPTS